ncbi:mycothione reductase [Mycolicibacterium sediminis]|uniref:Mycothione reductase n=1 Tax=Mycolicibacterium sediminis TaxID=1286180 RepID=A0A7I7QMU3_9MYCO|nr:mycothione reductase [Mycolicibacterium sediminis]BBY27709.1 mycothione reductase [Mycolicibacterium sediminis]
MHHDVLIIGSGSGNSVINDSFADLSVGIVEERRAGGTCLNFGCIPSKMLVYAADVHDTVGAADRYDVDAELGGLRWADLRDRVFTQTDARSDEGRKGREDSENVTFYSGHAEFTGPRAIRVRDVDGNVTEVTADQIVLANGGRPEVPPVVADSGLPYETSDTVMRIDDAPRHLAILGGGYIAAELAHVFAAAGSRITIIEKSDRLLGGPQDDELRRTYTDLVRDQYDLRLGAKLTALDGEPGALRITLDDGSTIEADVLLVAAGRRPNSDRLELDKAGVDVRDDGRVVVDEFGRTTADGVFALGDVCTPIPLKHVANREAEVVSHNLLHPDQMREFDHDLVPSAVFTDPQMASVGLTEQKCRDSHPDYLVGRKDYGETAYGWALRDDSGFCKVLVDGDSHRILGAHVLGPQAATLIQIFVVAMKFGIRADDLAHQPFWIHPALTEVVENALLSVKEAA